MSFSAKPWVRHKKGLSHDGRSVCTRCQLELPYLIPVIQTVCAKEDRLYLGDIPEAVDCAV